MGCQRREAPWCQTPEGEWLHPRRRPPGGVAHRITAIATAKGPTHSAEDIAQHSVDDVVDGVDQHGAGAGGQPMPCIDVVFRLR